MEKEYIYEVKLVNSGLSENIQTSMPFNKDDFVLVEEVNEYGLVLFIAQIIEERSGRYFINHCSRIIQRIDLSDYMEERRKKEEKEELQHKLRQEIQNADPLEVAKALSKTNETIQKLYEEYKSLC